MSDCFGSFGCSLNKYYYDKACEAYEKALETATKIRDETRRLETSIGYAGFMRNSRLGDQKKALEKLSSALSEANLATEKDDDLLKSIKLAKKIVKKWARGEDD